MDSPLDIIFNDLVMEVTGSWKHFSAVT